VLANVLRALLYVPYGIGYRIGWQVVLEAVAVGPPELRHDEAFRDGVG